MKVSRKGEYAIKALMYLAGCGEENGATTAEISRVAKIPEPFLNQIMLSLRNGGLVRSRRGARGGHVLNRPPSKISVGEIARLMDGPLAPISCASVTAYEPCPSCIEPETCKLRFLMREVRDAISEIIDKTTLDRLL